MPKRLKAGQGGRISIAAQTPRGDDVMTQTNNPLLDQFAKMMTDAAGAAQGVRREVETVMKAQGERVLNTMDVVKREEFEVVKAMAERARAENEKLEARIVALEASLAVAKIPPQA
jgi:BMFP domain-containing protein YqiC